MKMTNKMQLCRIIYYSLAALHVSSVIFAHHQEHPNCITAYVAADRQRHTCVIPEAVIQLQLCGIICYSLAALHVSSVIFAHHQEHLNCITLMSLPAGSDIRV